VHVRWTSKALGDLGRLHAFLAPVNLRAAAAVFELLSAAPDTLVTQPRLGRALPEFAPRDVRRLIAGDYEVRYELAAQEIWILRLWHTREDR
jgi:plasmid stabilization system protein ParE